MTRQEHIEWCKKRALDSLYYDGNLVAALASMGSDLSKHPETENHPGIRLGMELFARGELNTGDKMQKFILGFN